MTLFQYDIENFLKISLKKRSINKMPPIRMDLKPSFSLWEINRKHQGVDHVPLLSFQDKRNIVFDHRNRAVQE